MSNPSFNTFWLFIWYDVLHNSLFGLLSVIHIIVITYLLKIEI